MNLSTILKTLYQEIRLNNFSPEKVKQRILNLSEIESISYSHLNNLLSWGMMLTYNNISFQEALISFHKMLLSSRSSNPLIHIQILNPKKDLWYPISKDLNDSHYVFNSQSNQYFFTFKEKGIMGIDFVRGVPRTLTMFVEGKRIEWKFFCSQTIHIPFKNIEALEDDPPSEIINKIIEEYSVNIISILNREYSMEIISIELQVKEYTNEYQLTTFPPIPSL